ncbi:MAG: hypothetical protein LBL20_05295 [Treponema sp.]|nr:hypothetical protein [Treponema sp.]
MTRKALLAAPVFGEGRGGGHLVRSAALVRELRALGREAYLYLPGPESLREGQGMAALLGGIDPAWILGTDEELSCRFWEWIVLDRFQTAEEEFKHWAALAPVIGLDEGGLCGNISTFSLIFCPGFRGYIRRILRPRIFCPCPETGGSRLLPFRIRIREGIFPGFPGTKARARAAPSAYWSVSARRTPAPLQRPRPWPWQGEIGAGRR